VKLCTGLILYKSLAVNGAGIKHYEAPVKECLAGKLERKIDYRSFLIARVPRWSFRFAPQK
jgi:hypothetical protein